MSDEREEYSVEYNSNVPENNLPKRGRIKSCGAIQYCADTFNDPKVNGNDDIAGVKLASSLNRIIGEACLAHEAEQEHLVNGIQHEENNAGNYGANLVGEIKSEISSSYRETIGQPESIHDDREH